MPIDLKTLQEAVTEQLPLHRTNRLCQKFVHGSFGIPWASFCHRFLVLRCEKKDFFFVIRNMDFLVSLTFCKSACLMLRRSHELGRGDSKTGNRRQEIAF